MKTILVVDDELEVAQAVEAILEDEGYEILSAGDGLEAQKKIQEKRPDLVISDIMMPRCSGNQLLKAIKEDKKLRSIPVILMSAARNSEGPQEPDGFLKKPFDLDELLSLVEKTMKSR